ncbi:MAG: hypothetical protein Q4D29_11980, partial [Lachnospiraceae bacterium]|nr:hypothetical protein [Lachnospiraceae bacterium]
MEEKKIIWARCPKCGCWCCAEKKNTWGRVIRVFGKKEDRISEVAASYGERIGMKACARLVGKIVDKHRAIWQAPFEAIDGDKYKFYCSKCENSWGTDDPSVDQTDAHEICKEAERLYSMYEEVSQKNSEGKLFYIKQIESVLQRLLKYECTFDYQSDLYDVLACTYYFGLQDQKNAYENIEKSLQLCPDDKSAVALRGVFRLKSQVPYERYQKLQDIIQYKEAPLNFKLFSKQKFQLELQEAANDFGNLFLEIPKEKRKYLVIDKEFRFLPDSFLVLTPDLLSLLDEKGLSFPNGYANSQVLYICHPYNPSEYLEAENYKA